MIPNKQLINDSNEQLISSRLKPITESKYGNYKANEIMKRSQLKLITIEKLLRNIGNNIEELKEIYCDVYPDQYKDEPITENEIKKSTVIVKNIIKDLSSIYKIIDETFNEYDNILNKQIDLMSIDEYNSVRLLIKESKDNTNKDLARMYISKDYDITTELINLLKNVEKKRNPSDLCKRIYELPSDFSIYYYQIYLTKPEMFILGCELIV